MEPEDVPSDIDSDIIKVKYNPFSSVSAEETEGGNDKFEAPGAQKLPVKTNKVIQRIVELKYASILAIFATEE